MTGVGKSEDFVTKIGQPRRLHGQVDMPRLDLRGLRGQAVLFVSLGQDSDRPDHSMSRIGFQLLQQRNAGSRFFDENDIGGKLARMADNFPLQIGKIEPSAKDVQQIVVILFF